MPLVVALAAPHELLPALRLLFPHDASISPEALDSGAVFVARNRGVISTAMLVQVLPGALGLVWPPGGTLRGADELARTACAWLRERGVKVGHAFAVRGEEGRLAALAGCGFELVTELVALQRPTRAAMAPSTLTFAAETPPFTAAFRAALLATDRDTLDCPELNGTRTDDELLASFAEPAPGAAWYLARDAERPVGVVMLARGASEADCELAYLGVVPTARQRGHGRQLVAFACARAVELRASSVNVSVDSRNKSALQLYARAGFIETGRRGVWLAHLS